MHERNIEVKCSGLKISNVVAKILILLPSDSNYQVDSRLSKVLCPYCTFIMWELKMKNFSNHVCEIINRRFVGINSYQW